MQQGVSVIICCYNSAKRLPVTLEHLATQYFSKNIPWEIIVVNNASTDNTWSVADFIIKNNFNNKNIPIILINETRPGLMYAREKGVSISKYEFLLFCDDDNWLSSNYIEQVYDVLNVDSTIGVLGGFASFEPEFPLKSEIADFGGYYCNGPQESRAKNEHWVYGAGSAYRKSLLLEIKQKQIPLLTTGRTSGKLISGDDMELCFLACLLGYKIYAKDDILLFKHFVPLSRQTTDYLFKLFYWIGYSNFLLFGYQFTVNQLLGKKKQIFFFSVAKRFVKEVYKLFIKFFSLMKMSVTSELESNKNALKIDILMNFGFVKSILFNYLKVYHHRKKIINILQLAQ